jgi:hypothetical protein
MNNKNALGFIVLGLAMYAIPTFAQAASGSSLDDVEQSIGMVWLTFMGMVTGSIGGFYVSRDGVVRLADAWARQEHWSVRLVFGRVSEERIPAVGVRAGVSN